MRGFLLILLALIALSGAGGYYLYSKEAQGIPASVLEDDYLKAGDRFVEIDGARVRVREEGRSDGDVMLLLHGFSHSLETWDDFAAAFTQSHRVVRYDLLGHGLTGPDPRRRYAPAERAAFIGAVMDALEIDSAVIAGNSLGGLMAWKFAARAPERVDALALISPAAFPFEDVGDEPAAVPAVMKAYLRTAPLAGVRASAELIYADDGKITDERVRSMRDMMRREGNGEAMVRSLEEFTLPDPSADLAKVTAPTLLLWGSEDGLVPPSNGERMADAMPSARLRIFEGVGHSAQEEAPEETIAAVRAFLEGLPERSQADADRSDAMLSVQ